MFVPHGRDRLSGRRGLLTIICAALLLAAWLPLTVVSARAAATVVAAGMPGLSVVAVLCAAAPLLLTAGVLAQAARRRRTAGRVVVALALGVLAAVALLEPLMLLLRLTQFLQAL